MAYNVKVAAAAEAEADEAYEWIARNAPITARRWYTGLLEAISSLANNLERCALAPIRTLLSIHASASGFLL